MRKTAQQVILEAIRNTLFVGPQGDIHGEELAARRAVRNLRNHARLASGQTPRRAK